MRNNNRDKLFNNFSSDMKDNKEFIIKSSDFVKNKDTNNIVYDRIHNLVKDKKLISIVSKNDEREFLKYLQDVNFLPHNIVKSPIDPTVQLVCNKTWCVNTHYLAYAEGGVAVLGIVAAVSVYLAAATAINGKDEFDFSIEIAKVLGGELFAKKVKDKLEEWISKQPELV